MKLKITTIGNSAGVILPKELLARLRLEKGDELFALETPDGIFAAFAACGINAEDNTSNQRNEGWVHQLGTRRGYRKQGMGRALPLSGSYPLKARGGDAGAG